MPIDPAQPGAASADGRMAERLAALERSVRVLESYLQGGALGRVPVVDSLPPAGSVGRVYMLSGDLLLYRDTGSAWLLV